MLRKHFSWWFPKLASPWKKFSSNELVKVHSTWVLHFSPSFFDLLIPTLQHVQTWFFEFHKTHSIERQLLPYTLLRHNQKITSTSHSGHHNLGWGDCKLLFAAQHSRKNSFWEYLECELEWLQCSWIFHNIHQCWEWLFLLLFSGGYRLSGYTFLAVWLLGECNFWDFIRQNYTPQTCSSLMDPCQALSMLFRSENSILGSWWIHFSWTWACIFLAGVLWFRWIDFFYLQLLSLNSISGTLVVSNQYLNIKYFCFRWIKP